MDFIDQLKQFSERAIQIKEHLPTEEATKNALIMPFFQLLGYDVFNPLEVKPEFIADVGIKKGEKVDYAIYLNDRICMLVEAKGVYDNLSSHSGQLFRYFTTTKAKFGILTNGLLYKFYTDLEEINKMDEKPFLEIDLLDIKESLIPELKKFTKASFDETTIFNAASELKYSYEIKKWFEQQIKDPSEDFTIHVVKSFSNMRMTQSVIDKFKPIVKKTINNYISELMNDKISNALKAERSGEEDVLPTSLEDENSEETKSKVVTTEDELASLFIIKAIASEIVSPKRITGKDTTNYYGITLDGPDGKHNKWICRLRYSEKKKTLCFVQDNKEDRIIINDVDDIYQYKQRLLDIISLSENKKDE